MSPLVDCAWLGGFQVNNSSTNFNRCWKTAFKDAFDFRARMTSLTVISALPWSSKSRSPESSTQLWFMPAKLCHCTTKMWAKAGTSKRPFAVCHRRRRSRSYSWPRTAWIKAFGPCQESNTGAVQSKWQVCTDRDARCKDAGPSITVCTCSSQTRFSRTMHQWLANVWRELLSSARGSHSSEAWNSRRNLLSWPTTPVVKKCTTFVPYLASLQAREMFSSVSFVQHFKGHTHNILDQLFGVISRSCQFCDLLLDMTWWIPSPNLTWWGPS